MLTLAEASHRALMHSPEIQTALARVRIAEAEARQTRLLPNPVLSVVLRWPEGGGKPVIEAGLAADLVSLLTLPGRTTAADARLRAAAAEALSQALDVLSAVQERYVAVQANDELLIVLQDRLGIIDRLLAIARSRLNLGEGTRLDVLSLEVQRVELQTEIADRHLERREQRLALARLIGEPSGPIDWRLEPWETFSGILVAESQWVRLGLENRPEVRQQRYELAALGAEYRLTRFAPFEGAEAGIEAAHDDLDSEAGMRRLSGGSALATPLPLFDFGQARRRRAEAALIEAQHKLTQVRRQVVEETRRAYAVFAASHQNLQRTRNELIPLAQRRLEQAEAQFRGGQTDVTGLLLAEEQLRAARTRLVELERRNYEGLIRLHRSVGGSGVAARIMERRQPATAPTTAPATQAADAN
ncbi:TolC family protein [Fontivita pretiosa]|uniref:TolC family protein n=1 Tax=Fontivita pretiosa TaxID=2989684 RepID=UPI003D178D42